MNHQCGNSQHCLRTATCVLQMATGYFKQQTGQEGNLDRVLWLFQTPEVQPNQEGPSTVWHWNILSPVCGALGCPHDPSLWAHKSNWTVRSGASLMLPGHLEVSHAPSLWQKRHHMASKHSMGWMLGMEQIFPLCASFLSTAREQSYSG